MTNYKGTQVLYVNEYGQSIKTIADVDEDGTVYFEPNKAGLVLTAKLESLIAHGQLLESDWEYKADQLFMALGAQSLFESISEFAELEARSADADDLIATQEAASH